jgi:uncharacterized RDD family membrane protein YckC
MSTGTEGTAGTNRFAPPTAEVADVATGGTELAGRGMRLLAVLIDGLIQGAIYWILTIVAFRALDPRSGNISAGLIVGQIVLGFALFVLIQGFLLHTQGQTVGKKLLGLRYLVGWVIVMIPFVGAIYALVDCLMIFRDSRKCVHDNIADTIVVKA